MKELIGNAPINPLVFYTGKTAGYFLWVIYLMFLSGIQVFSSHEHQVLAVISYLLSFFGTLLVIISLFNLGKSTRLGLPGKKTVLKNKGIYRFSRNPMYLGFDLWTLSCMLITLNPWIICLGIYSLVVYHLIIRGEEKFLQQRFGQEYVAYRQKVRRYF